MEVQVLGAQLHSQYFAPLLIEHKNLDFYANLHTQCFKASTEPGTNTAINRLNHFIQVQFWIILTDFSMYNQTQLKNVSIYFVIFVFCIFQPFFLSLIPSHMSWSNFQGEA